MKETKKILLVRIGAIGDVIHTSNSYRAIKSMFPDYEIHYLTSKLIKPLIENAPELTKVIEIDGKNLKPFSKYFFQYANLLKAEKYDIVLNMQPSIKTRLLLFFAGIKKQYNYRKTFKLHAVTNFWQVAKKAFPQISELPELKIELNKNLCKETEKEMEKYPRPHIIFNAGGMFSKRQGRTYPVEKWFELGKLIQEKYKATIIMTGANEDKEFLSPLKGIPNSVYKIGELSLEKSVSLIKEADLIISGDSGPLHLATALGTKAIGLYGSMPISRTGPYGQNACAIKSDLPCVPCNRRKCKFLQGSVRIYTPCMENISIEQILKEIEKML